MIDVFIVFPGKRGLIKHIISLFDVGDALTMMLRVE